MPAVRRLKIQLLHHFRDGLIFGGGSWVLGWSLAYFHISFLTF